MDELTRAERAEFAYFLAWHDIDFEDLVGKVARIKADAHAAGVAEGRALRERVEALADEWERAAPLCSDEEESVRRLLVRELRATLAGTSPQVTGAMRQCGAHYATHPTRPHLCAICTLPAGHGGDHDNLLTRPTPHEYRDDATAIGDSTGYGGPVGGAS